MIIEVIYEMRRHDSPNFHGWIIWECSEGMESVYFQDANKETVQAVWNDLREEIRRA